MILSNLRFRARQYTQEHRAKLIKWGLISLAIVIALLLFIGGVESWKEEKYRKRISELELRYLQADEAAKEHERQAEVLKNAIEAKHGEIRAIQERAETAERRLAGAKAKTITLKEEYETIRYLPVPADVSCAELRAELAGLGYK